LILDWQQRQKRRAMLCSWNAAFLLCGFVWALNVKLSIGFKSKQSTFQFILSQVPKTSIPETFSRSLSQYCKGGWKGKRRGGCCASKSFSEWDSCAANYPHKGMEDALKIRASKKISDAHMDNYDSEGVVVVRSVLDDDWIEYMRTAVSYAMQNTGSHAEELGSTLFTDLELFERIPAFQNFALQSPTSGVAARVMDSKNCTLIYDQLFVRMAGNEQPTLWRQDQPYWAVKGDQVCSVFIALDDVPQSECLEFIAGSHRWGEFCPVHFMSGIPYKDTDLPLLPDIQQNLDDRKLETVSWDLEAGDCLVFHGLTVHGGPGNWGRGLSVRYAGDDATYHKREGEIAIPTACPGLKDGDSLSKNSARFPLAWSDPFYGVRGSQPTTVVQWSKGVSPPGSEWYT